MAKKKWIKQAIEHPGAFSKKAKEAGKSTLAYAREHEGDSGTLGKQARLAETLTHMSKKHKSKTVSHKKIRNSMYGEEGE